MCQKVKTYKLSVPRSLNADPQTSGSFRIQRFTASGTFVAGFGGGQALFSSLDTVAVPAHACSPAGAPTWSGCSLPVLLDERPTLVMYFFVDSWAIEVVGEGSCSDPTCFWPAALAGNVSRPYGIAQMDTSNDLLVAEPRTQRIERCGAADSR